ncbi:ABC transporter permease [Endothiovibrio diazotrophicus]
MTRWIERQRSLIDYTLASLGRRKGKNLGLFAVYTLIIFLLASVLLFSHAIQREAGLLLADSPEVIVQRVLAGRHAPIPESYLEQLRKIRGVRGAEGRLWGYFYDPAASANYTFLVPPADPPAAGRVVIGEGIARTRGAGVGDVLAFRGHDGRLHSFTIGGLLSARSEIVSADLVLINEADYRGFFGVEPGRYTDIALHVANPREVRKVAQKIATRLPDSRPILRSEILRTYQSVFDWREGMVLVLLVGALLAFVIFAWEKASGLSAEERREIGILKAVGWETGDVLRMKLWEGGLISLGAFLLGYLLAYGHVFLFSSALFAPVLKGWAVLYPNFQLTPYVDGLQLATLFFFTVFPYTAATLIPIWRVAVTDPDTVMR